MKRNLSNKNVESLHTVNDMLDVKYGKMDTPSRDAFEARAKSWYYAEVLRNARKFAGITQKELAERIGKKREYVAALEKGETDMQLSTFILFSEAVGLKFSLTK